MLKGKQTVIGLETYGNEAYTEKHVKAKQNKQKIRVFQVIASRMLEQVCIRMSSACVRKLDHAYANPYLETLLNTETEQKPKIVKSSNLSCLKTERKPKTKPNKQM